MCVDVNNFINLTYKFVYSWIGCVTFHWIKILWDANIPKILHLRKFKYLFCRDFMSKSIQLCDSQICQLIVSRRPCLSLVHCINNTIKIALRRAASRCFVRASSMIISYNIVMQELQRDNVLEFTTWIFRTVNLSIKFKIRSVVICY